MATQFLIPILGIPNNHFKMNIQDKIKQHKKAIELLTQMTINKMMFEALDDVHWQEENKKLEQEYEDVLNNLFEKVF